MLRAASNAFLNAAGVEISGFGRPFGTPTAVRMVVIGVALLRTMDPEASAPGKGAMMIETSSGCPLATVLRVSEPLPYVTVTLWPVFASKPATIFWVGARIGPTASSVISLAVWARALSKPPHAHAMATISEDTFFIAAPSLVVDRIRTSVQRGGLLWSSGCGQSM